MRWPIAIICLWLAPALPAQPKAGVDPVLDEILKKHQLPALAAVVVRSDAIVATGAVGVRKRKEPARVTLDDRFHLGSNTKAMTATLVAMFVEAGKLSWKTTPLDVFPDLKDTFDPAYRDITLVDLLTHRAGIPSYTEGGSSEFREIRGSKEITGTPAEQRRSFLYWVLRRKPAIPPHTKMLYSNAGYALAGAIAEKIGGDSWESLIEKRLFQPLHMRGGFGWPALEDPQQPWGHFFSLYGYNPHDPHGEYQLQPFLSPAGAANMSMGDYGRFLQMHLRGLAGRDTLLKAATVRFLHTPVDGYALGWGVKAVDGVETHMHAGSAGTFMVVAHLWPTLDLAIAVVTNAGGEDAAKACGEAIEALRTRLD